MLKVRPDPDWAPNQHFPKVVLLAQWRTLNSINGFNMPVYTESVIGPSELIGKWVNEFKLEILIYVESI